MRPDDDHHFRPREAGRWQRIAAFIEQNPSCLDIALENLDRWEAWGRTNPEPIRLWRDRIRRAQSDPEGFEHLLNFLGEDNADSEPLKSCSPFAGLDTLVVNS
jgi:hypothetical protein